MGGDRYADQRTLLNDPRVSANNTRPGYPPLFPKPKPKPIFSFLNKDDPEHARLRGMVQGSFTGRRIEAMRPAVQRIVDGLIDAMLAGPKPVDLVEALTRPTPSLVICELLGVPYHDHDFFQLHSLTVLGHGVSPQEWEAAVDALFSYLDGLMGEKLAHPADDLLSELGQRVPSGELTRDEAARMGMTLLIGGHQATSLAITCGVLALLEHPDQLVHLSERDDPELPDAAVDELMRYADVFHLGHRRVAVADIEIGEQVIRAGEGIIFLTFLANRDPDAFPDPDRLDLHRNTRNTRGPLVFGLGPHRCMGSQLGRMEYQVAIGTLVRRIPTLRLATTIEELASRHDYIVYGTVQLPVTW